MAHDSRGYRGRGFGYWHVLLSASILLVLTPFIVAGALFLQWRIRRALRQAARDADITSIDVEYRVIDREKDR